MKKYIVLLLICVFSVSTAAAQTMHSLLFVNMEEQGRENDRIAEFNQMKDFCVSIASALDYGHDLRCHSGVEFTSVMMEKEIASLNINEGDVVLLYYAGHGCNWDDDDWPHMALLDKQYWESTAYEKLRSVCSKAKLTLCISSCCNMDSEGRRKERQQYAMLDKSKAKELFLGFEGKKSIKTSSSVRGQYSYSWSAGSMLGSIYTISLRKTISEALSGSSTTALTWEEILDATEKQTLSYTNGKQLPQYLIENNKSKKVATPPAPVQGSGSPQGSVDKVWAKINVNHNGVECLEIHAKVSTHFMNQDGGRLIALFDTSKGVMMKDTNHNYCTVNGQVAVGADFGSHYSHSVLQDITLIIPNSEIHLQNGDNSCYVKLGIYDYQNKEYIHLSDYMKLDPVQ